MKAKSNLGRRILATLIDYTLVCAFSFWYIFEFGQPNDEGGFTISGLGALFPNIVWILYFVIAEKYCSATLGHEIVKLKVVSLDNTELSFGQVFTRRICDVIEICWCFGLIAFFIVTNNDKRQRLGDILAKTLVIGKNEVYNPVQNKF